MNEALLAETLFEMGYEHGDLAAAANFHDCSFREAMVIKATEEMKRAQHKIALLAQCGIPLPEEK